jgi:CHASE2 domain-containing sensor protein
LFANSLMLDPATLPLDQRAIFDATPQWMTLAWAVAIGAGVVGAVGLLVRRRLAEPALLVSLIAVVVQFSGLFLVRQLRELTPEDHLIVPVVILLFAYGFWQFAKLSRRRGWLQ